MITIYSINALNYIRRENRIANDGDTPDLFIAGLQL